MSTNYIKSFDAIEDGDILLDKIKGYEAVNIYDYSEAEYEQLQSVIRQAENISKIEIITETRDYYKLFKMDKHKKNFLRNKKKYEEMFDFFEKKYNIDIYEYIIYMLMDNKFNKQKCIKEVTSHFKIPMKFLSSLSDLIKYCLSVNKKIKVDILLYK